MIHLYWGRRAPHRRCGEQWRVIHTPCAVPWLEGGFKHNSFVYNLKDHIPSVVTWDKPGDPSLGSVTIVHRGPHPIP